MKILRKIFVWLIILSICLSDNLIVMSNNLNDKIEETILESEIYKINNDLIEENKNDETINNIDLNEDIDNVDTNESDVLMSTEDEIYDDDNLNTEEDEIEYDFDTIIQPEDENETEDDKLFYEDEPEEDVEIDLIDENDDNIDDKENNLIKLFNDIDNENTDLIQSENFILNEEENQYENNNQILEEESFSNDIKDDEQKNLDDLSINNLNNELIENVDLNNENINVLDEENEELDNENVMIEKSGKVGRTAQLWFSENPIDTTSHIIKDIDYTIENLRTISYRKSREISFPSVTVLSNGIEFVHWINDEYNIKIKSGETKALGIDIPDNTSVSFYPVFKDTRKTMTIDLDSEAKNRGLAIWSFYNDESWFFDSGLVARKNVATTDSINALLPHIKKSNGYGFNKFVDSSGNEVDITKWNGSSNVNYYIKSGEVGHKINYNESPEVTAFFTKTCDLGIEEGEEYYLPEVTTIYGDYIFQGWKNVKTGEIYNQCEKMTFTGNEDITYEATFSKDYQLYLDFNGLKDKTGPIEVVLGNKIEKPEDPKITGYEFDDWYKDSEYMTKWNFETDTISNFQTTIYAKFNEISYNIIYDFKGAIYKNGYTPIIKRLYSQEITLPNSNQLEKEGWTFVGFYDNKEYSGSPITVLNKDFAGDYYVYAKWEIKKYNINYQLNNGRFIEGYTPQTEHTYNTNTNLPTKDSIFRDGYEFDGWFLKSDFSDSAITKISNSIVDNVTIYAKWKILTYNITYNLNGGKFVDGFIPTKNFKITDTINLPVKENIDKKYFQFVAWYDNNDLLGSAMSNVSNISKDLNLYAKYELKPEYVGVKVNLSFDANGGEGEMNSIEYDILEHITIPKNNFTKKGFSFLKFINQNGEEVKQNSIMVITEDTVLTAQWVENSKSARTGNSSNSDYLYKNLGPLGDTNDILFSAKNIINKSNTWTSFMQIKKWEKSNDGKWSLYIDNQYKCSNIWIEDVYVNQNKKIVKDIYSFDNNGVMMTGFAKDDNDNYYYFETDKTNDEGKMVIGWKKIGDDYYYFNDDGKLAKNIITPDGYKVDNYGRWTKQI